MNYQGLFVGLTTLDCIYLSDEPLQSNQKIVAKDYLTAAGGPATNAAVAFSYFGNRSKLVTVLGQHALNHLIRSDLENFSLEMVDLMPQQLFSPSVSSIIVNEDSGERSIISLNALKSQGKRSQIPQNVLQEIDIVLIDGHQIDVSLEIIDLARDKHIPIVMDGGSWKPGLEKLLAKIDYAVCSANFYPPHCTTTGEVINFLQSHGIDRLAITQGQQPIIYCEGDRQGTILVPTVQAIDTLGAGDIFHGVFCHYILQQNFTLALNSAAQVASKSCQYFGTRAWLKK